MNHPTSFSSSRKYFASSFSSAVSPVSKIHQYNPDAEFEASIQAFFSAPEGVPPVSNTGVKSRKTILDEGLNIEVSPDFDGYVCHIDTLTFTVLGSYFGHNVKKASAYLQKWTSNFFMVGGRLEKRLNGYQICYAIVPVDGSDSPYLGYLGVSEENDNMRGRWCFHLTGEACSAIIKWVLLFDDLATDACSTNAMAGRITRIDIALDDLKGQHPLKECEASYDGGLFVTNGAPPKAHTIRHKQGDKGDTLYVGSRTSQKYLRCYEKGKQLGDSQSEWVRYEGELKNDRDRPIPFDILIKPLAYLKGMYPKALSWMKDGVESLAFLKVKAGISIDNAIKWGKRQSGSLIVYLRECL